MKKETKSKKAAKPVEKKPYSHETTTRFMQAVGEIMMKNKREGGPFKDYRSMAESLHCGYTVFSQYADNTRNVTIEMCYWLHKTHGVNLNWLIAGTGEKYKTGDNNKILQKLEERTSETALRLERLEKLLMKRK